MLSENCSLQKGYLQRWRTAPSVLNVGRERLAEFSTIVAGDEIRGHTLRGGAWIPLLPDGENRGGVLVCDGAHQPD